MLFLVPAFRYPTVTTATRRFDFARNDRLKRDDRTRGSHDGVTTCVARSVAAFAVNGDAGDRRSKNRHLHQPTWPAGRSFSRCSANTASGRGKRVKSPILTISGTAIVFRQAGHENQVPRTRPAAVP
jgi:hypothetical protein